ncbi:error-prone DNA polymerase [Albimonas donghaensis]|uniref:error-prone DNA polymerase n=1 Tax=Albimonas donghaensis TaxID=356660 RepID=UPI001FDED23B|nr:error-prone DNA polymerase [Albimonas donghaensis]
MAPQSLPRLIPAALLALEDGQELVALPVDRAGWSRLTRLLTVGKRRAGKGECRLTEADVIAHAEGLILLWRAPDPLPAPAASGAEGWLAEAAGSRRPAAPPRRRPTRGASAGGAARSDGPASGAGARPNAPRGLAPEPPLAPTGDSASASAPAGDSAPAPAPAAALPPRRKAGDAAGPSAPGPHAPPSQGGAGAPSKTLARWTRRLPGQVFCLAAPAYDGRDAARLDALAATAEAAGAPLVASAAPLMHRAARRRLADVLACIREGTTIDRLGRLAQPNAERRLRAEAELRRIFGPHAHAVDRAAEIAGRCRFALTELAYEYPDEVSRGENPQSRLERLTEEGLALRYPDGPPPRVRAQADHELALIGRLNYAPYFLTVRDLVAFAESRGILCQGRGSAANSIVCYALRVTSIGPEIASMVFERFVSEARDEPPDIDVDFEHERREEVIQHIYERYGRHRAGLCATVIHYRARRAIREVGRAMGLSADAIGALASQVWGWSADAIRDERIREVGLDPGDPRLALTLDLVAELIGFPRHLSQHVGGFIITKGRLDELVPIENAAMEDRTTIEWDKDDIDALGILKVDVLSLGMLTCVRKAFELIERHGGPRWDLATLPPEDPEVYDMLCEADSVGVFQVESRAQMNFLPRMRPRCFYDLVIEVAIVRPGPIQGDMVHPYLRRRRGEEVVTFPSDELGEVLGKTLGVPLFQEQAMQIAIIGAGFSPEEADRLRRALATFRKSGTIGDFRARFLAGMAANGYEAGFAERCFSQIEGFGEYGFPESHAASFALLVYASAWLKRRHPAAFACALLNAQPMGFYAPAQIVRDARGHGVEVRPVCVNASYWDNVLEPAPGSTSGFALRLGFRQIKAMKEEDAAWLSAARGNGYRSAEDVWRRAGLGPAAIAVLAEADAFAGLGLGRRDALWQAKAISGEAPLPLFEGLLEGEGIEEPPTLLPAMTEAEEVVEDYVALRLTLRAHPLALLRSRLSPGFEGLALAGGADAGGVEPPAPAGPAGRGARIAGGAPGAGGAQGGSVRDGPRRAGSGGGPEAPGEKGAATSGPRRIASPGQGDAESPAGADREGEEQRGDRLALPSSSAQAHGSRSAQEEDGAPSPARRHLAARRRPLPNAPREGAEGPALAQGGDAWRGRAETGRPPAPGAGVSGGTDSSDRVAPPSPPAGAPEAGEAGAPGREPSPSRRPSRGEPRAEGAVPARLRDMSGGGRTAASADPSAEIAGACMRGPDEQSGAPPSGRAAGGLRRDPSAGPDLAVAGDGRAPRVGRPPVPGRAVSAGLRDAPGGGRGRAQEREDAARGARPELSGAGASDHGGGAGASGSTEPASARLAATPPARPDWPRPPACLPADFLHLPPERARVAVCGLVIVRQRPGSAGGVVFATLEDETGVVNVVIWQRVYEAFRREIIAGRLMRVLGRVQRDGKVVHVVAERIEDLSAMLDDLGRGARTMPDPAGPTDEARRPLPEGRGGVGGGGAGARHPRHQARKLFPSRDFH